MIVVLVGIVGGIAFGYIYGTFIRAPAAYQASLYQVQSGEKIFGLTIDGQINQGEWDSFEWCQVKTNYSHRPIIVYLTNDDRYLYLAIEVSSDVSEGDYKDYAYLCFLTENYKKIVVGKFKTMEIKGNGVVTWMAWDKADRLPVKYVTQTEEYAQDLASRIKRNEAVRVYDGSEIVNGEKGVYALFAYDITTLPQGMEAKTSLNGYRTYEAKIPLSALGVKAGQTLRIFGYINDSARSYPFISYPNSQPRSLAHPHWGLSRVPLQP